MFIVSFVAHLGGSIAIISKGKIVNTVCHKSVKLLKGIKNSNFSTYNDNAVLRKKCDSAVGV